MKRSLGVSVSGLALAVAAALLGLLAIPAGAQRRQGPGRPEVDRPDGPVWEVIRHNCISCHGIDDYAFFALDRAGWKSLIDTKHAGMKVALGDKEQTLLLDWLVKQFGPDSKPFARNYIPPKVTRFFTDPEAYRLLNERCTGCHPMTQIDEARFSADRWRAVLVGMRERGAQLTDEELETLVEWLSRVKGINPNQ